MSVRVLETLPMVRYTGFLVAASSCGGNLLYGVHHCRQCKVCPDNIRVPGRRAYTLTRALITRERSTPSTCTDAHLLTRRTKCGRTDRVARKDGGFCYTQRQIMSDCTDRGNYGTPFFERLTVCGRRRLELGDWLIRRLTRHSFQAQELLAMHRLSRGTCFDAQHVCRLNISRVIP